MINKVVGYGGFRSYAQQPYPTKKQGKELQESNQIWAATRRQLDHQSTLDNFNHYHTLYRKNHVEGTEPKDYHPEHVQRGAHSTLNFKGSSLSKAYDQVEAERAPEPDYRKGHSLLKTGTEHWKTNYQAEIASSAHNQMSKTSQTQQFSTLRSQSTGKALQKGLVDEELSKALSYKNRPYINNVATGITDYKFNFGEKIGSKPTDCFSRIGQPTLRDNPLKHGTNQLWTEIPGYQGFKPSEVPFEELKSKIMERGGQGRGDKKLNLVQNYHVEVPGYAGFKPRLAKGDNFRESCFEFKKK